MFLRCERCRSVYRIEAGRVTDQPAVVCSRCEHAFAPTPLLSLSILGTLGGAAVLPPPTPRPPRTPSNPPARVTAPPEPAVPTTPPARRSPTPRDELLPARSRVAAIVGGALALGLVVAAGAVLLPRLAVRPKAPPAATVKQFEADSLLLKDDLASLEKAIAAFAAAAAHAPDHPEFVARRAFATTLLALSLQDEAKDEAAEAERLTRQMRQLGSTEGDPNAALADDLVDELMRRVQEHDARRERVLARAEKLLGEAVALAKQAAAAPETVGVAPVVLAQAVLHASREDAARTESILSNLTPEERADPWMHWVRGFSRSRGSMSAAKARDARIGLEAALGAQSGLLRARVDLARVALALRPPDVEEAGRQLARVEEANPKHEAVARLRARIAAESGQPSAAAE